MPNDNRGASEPGDGLYGNRVRCYTPTSYGQYAEGYGTLRASGGDVGGGAEMLIVDTLIFDNAQITSKLNYSHPTWGAKPSSHKRSRTGNSGD
jgi:hypothetical protein